MTNDTLEIPKNLGPKTSVQHHMKSCTPKLESPCPKTSAGLAVANRLGREDPNSERERERGRERARDRIGKGMGGKTGRLKKHRGLT